MKKLTGTREWSVKSINIFYGCSNDCSYCIDENTLILMGDLSEKPIKDIEIGEFIIGIKWNEKNIPKFIKSQVQRKWNTIRKAIKIELENKKQLICSEDHRWYSNRGWKYTMGSMFGKNRRPYLTTNNSLPFLRENNYTNLEETTNYKKGYLSGMIKGDAHLKKHNIAKKGYSYQFRLALIDNEPLIDCQKYLKEFGVKTNWFEFNEKMNGIRTNKEVNIERIRFIIKNIKDKEFLRGFIAGVFDAEGSIYKNTLSIANSDYSILSTIRYGLKLFDFDFGESKDKRSNVIHIRIKGGYQEVIRFFQIFNTKIIRKRKIYGRWRKSSKILNIISLNKEKEMIDIQTTSGNFIANGFIAHNCYAKEMANHYGWKKRDDWKNMEINYRSLASTPAKVKNDINETGLYDYMFPSSHDITLDTVEFDMNKIQELRDNGKISKRGYKKLEYMAHAEEKMQFENHNYIGSTYKKWTVAELCGIKLKELLEAGNTVLIVSKPNFNAIDKLYEITLSHPDCSIIKPYRDKVEFRFTITSMNDKLLKKWESGAPPFWHSRLTSVSVVSGIFKTSVSVEPFLDEDPLELIKLLDKQSKNIDSYWLGCMSNQNYKHHNKENLLKIVDNVQKLPDKLRNKIKFKNSFRDKLK